ncbi:MAG: CorA family divalent cation transporter [Terrimicrobiaceae bacterium]
MVELPDTRGLICGFTLRANAPSEALDWELTSDPNRTFEGAVWLHFSLADVRAKKWISACERIPARAREILLDTDAHIRMEAVERGFAGVLGDLHYEFDGDPDRLGVMHLYVDESLVVTARLHALKVADQLRLQLRGGMVVPSTLRLLIQFLEDFSDTIAAVVAGQSDIVDEAEDRILKDRFLRDAGDLGSVRRLLARLRRHISAQRNALAHQAYRSPAWWSDKDAADLRSSIERLEGLSLDLESIQERARLLQEEIGGRTVEATNLNLYIVSLFTAIFLPLNLITGIFGMNVAGLPWLENPGGFLWVTCVMVLTLITSLGLLYWRRFF